MRIIKHTILVAAVIFGSVSCKDWLDITPSNQAKSEDIYKNEAGFRDVLLGVYTTMADSTSYGGCQTFLTMDLLGQEYQEVGINYSNLQDLKYAEDPNTSVKVKYIDPIWTKSYYAIANCNDLLEHVDNDPGIFNPGMYEMIKSEAMALRAFLHFELLRTYGPVPITANMDKPAIPLVTSLTNKVVPQSSVKEVVDFALKELDAARKMIAPVDPLGPAFETYVEEYYLESNFQDQYEHAKDDGFRMYRRSRFNYYGMTAAMARIALWGGRDAEALEYAGEVIDSGKFPMASEIQGAGTNSAYVEYESQNEYITSLYVNNMTKRIYEVYFNPNSAAANPNALYFTPTSIDNLFGNDRDFDWRYKLLLIDNNAGYKCTYKYNAGYRIPLLKVSEMYLICAEASGNPSYLQELRDHRGFMNYQTPVTDLEQAIRDEYRKEFLAEGQIFYYYKRKNLPQLQNGAEAGEAVYVLPLPDNEIEYGSIKPQ